MTTTFLDKLRGCDLGSETIDFPRRGEDGKPIGRVRLIRLKLDDHVRARMQARAYCQKRGLKPEDMAHEPERSILSDAVACEVLSIALTDPEPDGETGDFKRVFADGLAVRDTLTADEIGTLFSAYLMLNRKHGALAPAVSSDDEVTAWCRRLTNAARDGRYDTIGLETHELLDLAIGLAKRIVVISDHAIAIKPLLTPAQREDLERLLVAGDEPTEAPELVGGEVTTETAAAVREVLSEKD